MNRLDLGEYKKNKKNGAGDVDNILPNCVLKKFFLMDKYLKLYIR